MNEKEMTDKLLQISSRLDQSKAEIRRAFYGYLSMMTSEQFQSMCTYLNQLKLACDVKASDVPADRMEGKLDYAINVVGLLEIDVWISDYIMETKPESET